MYGPLQNGQVELDGAFKPANSIVQLNLAVGAACLLAVGGVEALTLWRLHLCRQAKLSWCHFGFLVVDGVSDRVACCEGRRHQGRLSGGGKACAGRLAGFVGVTSSAKHRWGFKTAGGAYCRGQACCQAVCSTVQASTCIAAVQGTACIDSLLGPCSDCSPTSASLRCCA